MQIVGNKSLAQTSNERITINNHVIRMDHSCDSSSFKIVRICLYRLHCVEHDLRCPQGHHGIIRRSGPQQLELLFEEVHMEFPLSVGVVGLLGLR